MADKQPKDEPELPEGVVLTEPEKIAPYDTGGTGSPPPPPPPPQPRKP